MINLNKFPYKEIRPVQKYALEQINNNLNKRYILLQCSTGTGKSGISINICNSYYNGFILTSTKQLQDQYEKEFKYKQSLNSIKGKANYVCNINKKLNCECAPCISNKDLLNNCKLNKICNYYNKREEVLKSQIFLTSYAYFLRAIECANWIKQRDVIILDECHLLESQLIQWASIFLKPEELNTKYNIFSNVDFSLFVSLCVPPEKGGYEANKDWLLKIWNLIIEKRKELFKDINSNYENKNPDDLMEEELEEISITHKEYYEIDKLFKKLSVFFNSNNKNDWIIEPENNGLIMVPLDLEEIFKKYVDKWANKKVVFMSATILDIEGFCKNLGISQDDVLVINLDSEFDPNKSPIIYYPTGNMNYKNIESTMPKILENVKNILKDHKDDRGIIHTSNYKIAKYIYDNLNDERLIIKDEYSNNEKIIKEHTSSNKPTVLISPSLTTGVDLKNDLSRFQIIVKMPFVNLNDKRVKMKMETDENWYPKEMFLNFIQACGRSTRDKDDWSITYVLDSSFYYWIYKYKHWFFKQFLKRIIWKKSEFNLENFKKNNNY